MVMVEATAVNPIGRISPDDSGLWSAEHAAAFAHITKFIAENNSVPGVQLAHAGRKASTDAPWHGGHPLPPEHPDAWQPIAPSPIPFDTGYPTPRDDPRISTRSLATLSPARALPSMPAFVLSSFTWRTVTSFMSFCRR